VLNQKSVEFRNEPLNEVHHLLERINNQLAFGNLRLTERYIDSELKIMVRLSVVGAGRDIYDLIAYYQWQEPVFVEPKSLAQSEINSPFIHRCDNGKQEPMLVTNIELMEQPERHIHSVVWLYRFEDVSRIFRDLLYFSIAHHRCVLMGSLANRKVGVLVRLPATQLDKLPSEMVKGTPQIVDCVSEYERNVVRDGLDLGYIKRRVLKRGYRVRLGTDSVRFIREESLDCRIEITDVLFGPFNFQSDSVSATLHAHAL